MKNLLQQGITAAQSGLREEARSLLLQVVEADERNEQAWLWLAGVVDDPDDMRTSLENALQLNPENTRARQGLAWVMKQYGDQMDARHAVVSPVASTPPEPTVTEVEVQPQPPVATGPATATNQQATTPAPTQNVLPCMYCGAPTSPTQERCPQCRNSLMLRTPARNMRSAQLTILAVLSGIGTVLSILSGGLLFLLGFLFASSGAMIAQQPELYEAELQKIPGIDALPGNLNLGELAKVVGNVIYGIALAFLIGGVFYIFVTRGLWRQRRWAYIVAIIFSVIGGLYTCFSLTLAIMLRSFSLLNVFEIGLQGLMITLTVLSHRDFYGSMVRYLPQSKWTDDLGHYNNGVAFKQRGMWYQAAKEWEAAVTKAPTNPKYLHALALMYGQLKQFDEARTTLDRALAITPHDPQLKDSRSFIDQMAGSKLQKA